MCIYSNNINCFECVCRPCILIFDSLMMSPHYGVVRTLREYVYIWNLLVEECSLHIFMLMYIGTWESIYASVCWVDVYHKKISKDATCH